MPLSFSSNLTVRAYTWTNWKAAFINRGGITQYDDDGLVYTIYFYDIPEVHTCTVWKGDVPDSIINNGYSQAQNDSDKSDFETNYLPTSNKRISRTDTFGDPVYTDISYASAFGLLPGVNSGTANGYTPTSATSTVALRATTYIQPAAAAQRSVSSSSANDSSAGTGARTIRITYYDGSMVGPKTTDVTMNGVTAVATSVSDIRFIEKMEVLTVGSTGANAGTISLFVNNAGGGGTVGTIAISDNSTFWAHHYIPTGKTCYLLAVRCGSTVTNGATTVQAAGNPLTANLAQKNLSGSIRYGSANQVVSMYEWEIPITIAGPNFVFMNTRPDAATASTTLGSFDYLEF
jgi:hypothetical protein